MKREEIYRELEENPELLALMEEAIDAPSEAVQKATETLRNQKEDGDSTDMVRVRDYIENNDNIRVRIARKFSKDPCDPLTETIYEGMLSVIPEELRDFCEEFPS